MSDIYTKRLPLVSVCNARDLGGYPVKGGGVTKYGAFLRSARPCGMTPEDIEFMREYGVTVSLDFRSETECGKWPSSLKDEPWVDYRLKTLDVRHVIISDNANTNAGDGVERMAWPDVYIMMAEEYKEWFRDILETAGECDGCMHYHCTTGKDRTGMISAMLLGIAGVYEEDIVADYCVSQVYLEPVFRELIKGAVKWAERLDMEDAFFKTAPANMSALLEHFRSKYGGISGYAESIGVTKECIGAIRRKLLA